MHLLQLQVLPTFMAICFSFRTSCRHNAGDGGAVDFDSEGLELACRCLWTRWRSEACDGRHLKQNSANKSAAVTHLCKIGSIHFNSFERYMGMGQN